LGTAPAAKPLRKEAGQPPKKHGESSAPGRIRTCNPRFRILSVPGLRFRHASPSAYLSRCYVSITFQQRFNQMEISFNCGGICGGAPPSLRMSVPRTSLGHRPRSCAPSMPGPARLNSSILPDTDRHATLGNEPATGAPPAPGSAALSQLRRFAIWQRRLTAGEGGAHDTPWPGRRPHRGIRYALRYAGPLVPGQFSIDGLVVTAFMRSRLYSNPINRVTTNDSTRQSKIDGA
jgi:hypothetical protein